VDDGPRTAGGSLEQIGVEDRTRHDLDMVQTGEVVGTSRGEVVDDHDPVTSRLAGQGAAQVGTDEPGSAGDDDVARATTRS